MNNFKKSRTPFQNDLLDQPGQMACLSEQGVPINFNAPNDKEVHLTLDWMFTVPFLDPEYIAINVGSTPLDVPQYGQTIPWYSGESNLWTPWAVAAHQWCTYVKRSTSVTFLPIKAYTPVKVRIDIAHAPNYDQVARRNFTMEYDDAGCHPTTIKLGSLFPLTTKLSSVAVPRVEKWGINMVNTHRMAIRDANVRYSIITQPQPGVVFPRNYNVRIITQFQNVFAATITTPSAIYSLAEREYASRMSFIAPEKPFSP